MISAFFIDRPRFAMVVSIVITLAGALALLSIPVTQYPAITPPSVQVSTSYSGASAEVVADSVGAPIEAAVNGVENMLYMSSSSSDNGGYSLTITFEVGTDPDIAQVNVQNRIQQAASKLPGEVSRQGVTVRTRSSDRLLIRRSACARNCVAAISSTAGNKDTSGSRMRISTTILDCSRYRPP